MPPNHEVKALIGDLGSPPPPGSPYGVPIPGTAVEGRTAVYRHYRYKDSPLLETFDPEVRTFHELFQDTVQRLPNNRCLGTRPWDPATRTWESRFVWQTYAEVAERAKNFGSGLVELHRRVGVAADKFGVGLWCQNRPEWQITGENPRDDARAARPPVAPRRAAPCHCCSSDRLTACRHRPERPVAVHRFSLRDPGP